MKTAKILLPLLALSLFSSCQPSASSESDNPSSLLSDEVSSSQKRTFTLKVTFVNYDAHFDDNEYVDYIYSTEKDIIKTVNFTLEEGTRYEINCEDIWIAYMGEWKYEHFVDRSWFQFHASFKLNPLEYLNILDPIEEDTSVYSYFIGKLPEGWNPERRNNGGSLY